MKLVLDPYRGGYAEGFVQNKVYRFSRANGEHSFVGRLSDSHPAFNVAGLYYSEFPDSLTVEGRRKD